MAGTGCLGMTFAAVRMEFGMGLGYLLISGSDGCGTLPGPSLQGRGISSGGIVEL